MASHLGARAMALVVMTASLAFALAGPAAALPVGSPKSLREARPADVRPRGAAMERWSFDFVNPRSGATFEVLVVHRGQISYFEAYGLIHDSAWAPSSNDWSLRLDAATGTRPEWRGEDSVVLTRAGTTWRLRVTGEPVAGQRASVDAVFRDSRAGITAGEWRRPPWPGVPPGTLAWSVPVATSRVSGQARLASRVRSLKGWRGSIEHMWGSQSLDPENYANLVTAVVHTGGGAWLLNGLNRLDYLTGPGAEDAFWLGVRARVGRGDADICRPRMDHEVWLPTRTRERFETRRTRCDGTTTIFRNSFERNLELNADGAALTHPVTTNRGGLGWLRVFSRWGRSWRELPR